MKKTAKPEKFKKLSPLEAVHEAATGLYSAGIIKGKTMREYDELCLPKVKELSPTQIKKMRLREKVSQFVFAKYLNISLSTIKHWEQGEKKPRGPSLKLLNLVMDHGLEVLAK